MSPRRLVVAAALAVLVVVSAALGGVANRDGTGRRTIASHPAVEGHAAWSPDGRQIAFTSTRGGDSEIWVSSASGSGMRQLTKNRVADVDPTWSPDGRRIAFVQSDDLWTMDVDGRRARRVLAADDLCCPEWSPDGRWIALTLDDNIAVVAPGGGRPRLVAWAGDNDDATWSPDSRRLAFTSDRDVDWDIYVVPLEGGPARRLTKDDETEAWLDWSPDGVMIAFARGDLDEQKSSIYIIGENGTGGGRVPLPHPVDQPSWQPIP